MSPPTASTAQRLRTPPDGRSASPPARRRPGSRERAPADPSRAAGGSPAKPGDAANLKELGAFLRAHRERTSPDEVGLSVVGRRRTPGLRREEVAALSGVGLAWYSWIEQGRVTASKQVLEAIGRTLRLGPVASRHLLALAGHLPAPKPEEDHELLAQRSWSMLDAWTTSPAVLLDRRLDITAWNAAYAAVWSDPGEIEPSRRNLMWTMVGDRRIRERIVDWESMARAVLAQLRTQTAPRMDDERTQELYRVLNEDFPELRDWWSCQGVADLTSRRVDARIPGRPELRLRVVGMRPVDDIDALLLLQTPVRAADHETVDAVVRAERFPASRAG